MATWLLDITDCQYYAMSIFRVVQFYTGCTFVVYFCRYNLWYGKESKHNLLITYTTNGENQFNLIKIVSPRLFPIFYWLRGDYKTTDKKQGASVQNFVTDRENLIPKYFFNRPNTLKLSSLFNKKKPETVRKLCKLIDIINKKISSP